MFHTMPRALLLTVVLSACTSKAELFACQPLCSNGSAVIGGNTTIEVTADTEANAIAMCKAEGSGEQDACSSGYYVSSCSCDVD